MATKTGVVHSDPKILGGTPVFVDTRVPVQVLFDCLEAGDSLDRFLDPFPTVSREQALAALELAREALMAGARLVDEQMPRDLVPELAGHEVRTVGEMGWKGLDNGELLARAATQFDALLSRDKSIPLQIDFSRFRIGLILIRATSNRIEALRPLVPAIQDALAQVRPGEARRVGR